MKQGEKKSDKRALDELFTRVKQYSSSGDYHTLLRFNARFKRHSPFNAMLVHVQKPGAKYVLLLSSPRAVDRPGVSLRDSGLGA